MSDFISKVMIGLGSIAAYEFIKWAAATKPWRRW